MCRLCVPISSRDRGDSRTLTGHQPLKLFFPIGQLTQIRCPPLWITIPDKQNLFFISMHLLQINELSPYFSRFRKGRKSKTFVMILDLHPIIFTAKVNPKSPFFSAEFGSLFAAFIFRSSMLWNLNRLSARVQINIY